MITRFLSHVRRHAVGYLALTVALGGTSYAATALPRNSVGEPQLRVGAVTAPDVRDGAITPPKVGKWPTVIAMAASEVQVSGYTDVPLGATYDPMGMHDPAVPQDLTVPVDGVYSVQVSGHWNGDPGQIQITKRGNGNIVAAGAGVLENKNDNGFEDGRTVSAAGFVRLREGDAIRAVLISQSARAATFTVGLSLVAPAR